MTIRALLYKPHGFRFECGSILCFWDVCLKSAPSARYPCLASDEAEQNNNLDILKYKHPLISTNPIIKRDKVIR